MLLKIIDIFKQKDYLSNINDFKMSQTELKFPWILDDLVIQNEKFKIHILLYLAFPK